MDFLVVGGVGAVLQGAPTITFDLDIVHSRNASNVQRLLQALKDLDAHYRMQPERRLKPAASHLSSPGHQLLITRFGPLDLLGMIGDRRSYEELLPHSSGIRIARKLVVPVLKLGRLIEVKEETAGEKDRAVLPVLKRTLQEQNRKRSRRGKR